MIQTCYPSSCYTCRKVTYVQIPLGSSFDYYIKTLDKHVRQNLRTSYNRLKTDMRNYNVKTYVNQPIPRDVLSQLFRLYWRRMIDKKLYMGLKRFLPIFLRMRLNPTIISLNRLPNVFYSIIYINNVLAGFCAGFTSRNGKIIFPFLATDSSFSRYSPGGILITESIRFIIENYDYSYFDLSRGDEKYKYAYGGIEHFAYCYEIDYSILKSTK
ncbi:MAG: GNAT family N-acetyltransferase [Syntrophobacteraceae bacterium]